MQLALQSRTKLVNGTEMPMLGLGTYQSPPGNATLEAVTYALKTGYRLVDTAKLYDNEKEVGEAIRKSGVPREEVFVTTKLWNSDHGYDAAMRAFNASLKRLDLDYVDLYLIHWPVPGKRGDSWKALAKLLNDGLCRSIGVSNYNINHLDELLAESDIVPAVNQVEFSPFLYQEELLRFCRRNKIQLEAYAPLTKGYKLADPRLKAVAAKYSRTPAQVMIRWGLQHEVVEIPKSVKPERIVENSRVFDFEISEEDMKALNALNEVYRTSWDPSDLR